MKTKLIIGTLLIIIVLGLSPSIPALQFNTITQSNKEYFVNEINKIFSEKSADFISVKQNGEGLKQVVQLYLEKIKTIDFYKLKKTMQDNPSWKDNLLLLAFLVAGIIGVFIQMVFGVNLSFVLAFGIEIAQILLNILFHII
jgi:hypothetical protein